eukprot:UN02675
MDGHRLTRLVQTQRKVARVERRFKIFSYGLSLALSVAWFGGIRLLAELVYATNNLEVVVIKLIHAIIVTIICGYLGLMAERNLECVECMQKCHKSRNSAIDGIVP